MNSHILTRYELNTLCSLNFGMTYYRSRFHFKENYTNEVTSGEWENSDEYVKAIKPDWDKVIFSNLLQKQPELSQKIESFWEKSKKEKYIESLFCREFEDKIYLKSVGQTIFNVNYYYSGVKERKEFIKKMIRYEPYLMNDLHDKNKTTQDLTLLSAYVELLPSHIKEIKDTKEKILENISKTKDFTESNFVQVLNCVVKSFPHDKEIYNFLKTHCSSKFEKFHTLRDKFKKVEDKYFSEFKEDEKFDIFNNSQEYRYIFCIKDSVLIDYFGIHKSVATNIQFQIHNCLKEYLKNNVSPDIEYTYSKKGLEINTSNFSYRATIEDVMERLKPCIKDILYSLDEKTKTNPDNETIPKMFNLATLKFDLENSLNNKDTYKAKKNKI